VQGLLRGWRLGSSSYLLQLLLLFVVTSLMFRFAGVWWTHVPSLTYAGMSLNTPRVAHSFIFCGGCAVQVSGERVQGLLRGWRLGSSSYLLQQPAHVTWELSPELAR
jgi:hypothetical protein